MKSRHCATGSGSIRVPDVELFYIEEPFTLAASQQAMPGVNGPGVSNALVTQNPQEFHEHIGTLPFFINFAFGYTSEVNWYEAAGIPIAVYDDFGRENPYPLMRIQAEVNGETVASVDTVVPISGEAECQRCHAAVEDNGNGSATQYLLDQGEDLLLSIDDPAQNVPLDASVEWASDLNILALYDAKHDTQLSQEPNPETGQSPSPVVCQTCHYTSALDLAQLGPLGPENDSSPTLIIGGEPTVIESLANGRNQARHKTMSNVMHSHHASVTGIDGEQLFQRNFGFFTQTAGLDQFATDHRTAPFQGLQGYLGRRALSQGFQPFDDLRAEAPVTPAGVGVHDHPATNGQ